MQAAFVAAVVSFAWLRFSENTVDNDLWGHVLYGQRYWRLGYVRGTEMLSWTAAGHPVINHEYLSEIFTGFVHRFGGGNGLWLYMVGMAALTVGLAYRAGRGARGANTWAALALLAASTNFIALGYAVRPQLFTTLGLVLELIVLRQVASGRWRWALLILPLIALWGNLHGGVLAGIVVLGVWAGMETIGALRPASGVAPSVLSSEAKPGLRNRLVLSWTLVLAGVGAMFLNPWGDRLVHWNVSATLRPRPQIHEWHPLSFSAGHAPYFIVAVVSLLAWLFSRRPRKLWEAATLLVLATMGVLHQRHAPLFGLANLILTPPHLRDAALRLVPHAGSLIYAFRLPGVQIAAAIALIAATGASLFKSFAAPKEQPFTIEVERAVYPVSAVEFIQAHQLFGKTITFFDWGQQHLWELPFNPVSFDGRFDTGYPAHVIAAHWDFYAGKSMRPEVQWDEAELAFLPTDSGGVHLLAQRGWIAIYRDALATLLIPRRGKHAALFANRPLHIGGPEALRGRKPFPDTIPLLATDAAPR